MALGGLGLRVLARTPGPRPDAYSRTQSLARVVVRIWARTLASAAVRVLARTLILHVRAWVLAGGGAAEQEVEGRDHPEDLLVAQRSQRRSTTAVLPGRS